MSLVVYAIGFAIGFVLGSKTEGASPVMVLTAGILVALGLGNYPYYPLPVFATTYFAALLGVVFGEVARR